METEETLILLNNWWYNSKVNQELIQNHKRNIYKQIYQDIINYREIIVLTGLRRVGKTTIIYQAINELLKNTDKYHIVYFTFDYNNDTLLHILNAYQSITGINWKIEIIYVFLDEIQLLRDWGSQIKLICDAFPNVKFILSGSASLQLEKTSSEKLAGRYFLHDIPVLSIDEYYMLKYDRAIDNIKLYENEILICFNSYIKKPFPELVNIDEESKIIEYINQTVISKIFGLDIIQEFNKPDINLLYTLLNIFYSEPGMILNIDALSRKLSKSKKDLEEHIYILEFSKLIKIIKNYRPSMMSESRKLKKIYPYDISLALSRFHNIDKGKIYETLIINKFGISKYWRERTKEVDALICLDNKIIPIEIKSSDTMKEEYTTNLNYFIEKYNSNLGIILYNGKEDLTGKIKLKNIKKIILYGLI
ncbi:ATP-binding protein [Ferroplasma sp.]|uniref:ATP-binding protein n=1 Tax=Ferroplasma sp. TaxID=2591003 RepID=UPI00307FB8F5